MGLAILDGNYAMCRAIYAPGDLVSPSGEYTSGLYKFIKMIHSYRDLGKLVVVFDGGRPEHRTSLLPDYKKRDKEDTEENRIREQRFNFTMSNLRSLLPKMGISTVIVPGNEADDVIYRLAQSRSHLKETTYVISDDSDYFHFINLGNVKVFRAMKDEYWDAKVFEEKMGYPVTHYLLALSLTGTHNGVPGIKGIGEATAAKIMKKIATPTLENLYNCLEYDRSHYSRKIIDEWPLVKRNLYLIDPDKLPMTVDDVNNFYEKAKQSASLDLKYVLEQFKRFDFQSLTNIFSWLSTRE